MEKYTFKDVEQRKKIYNRLLKTLYKLDKEESREERYRINQNKNSIDDIINEIDSKIELIITMIEKLSKTKDISIAQKISNSRNVSNKASGDDFPFGNLLMGILLMKF